MNNTEKLTRLIIKALHPECESYKEAVYIEFTARGIPVYGNIEDFGYYPITIGRVLVALATVHGEWHITAWGNETCKIDKDINWKLTKDNGSEAVIDDQSIETIESLLKLFQS